MGTFDRMIKYKGGYLFLSHSHADIEKVREIRNNLEKTGFEPLCFYLKCLNDDSEIEELIKREIDSREWFVFLDSENARNSKWVTMEREYIERTNCKKIISVDLDDPDAVQKAILSVTNNLKVYISYTHSDYDLAHKIATKLEEKDYLVAIFPDCMSSGDWWMESRDTLKEASHDGCVLSLITPEALKDPVQVQELTLTDRDKGNLIPVIVGNVELSDRFRYHLLPYNIYHLPDNPTDDEIEDMINEISNAIIENNRKQKRG
ncbi:MAG: toll/interleukin-1 receptor domain-containing protein [Clostridia bacterium]|nr:toll/interleukin-1 receptor domain-containing protein [Clostridia bacterium]